MSEPLRLLAGFALTASAAVAVALVISRLLRQRASARSAYIAWIVVLVAVLAPVRLFGSPVVLTVSAPQAEEAPAPTALPARTASPQTTALPVARATARPLPTDTVEAAPIARSTAAPVSAPAPTPSHVWTAEEILLAAYLAGVGLALGIQIARHARFSRLVRRWRSRPAEHTRLLFEEVCREMGVARAPRLWICGAADSPMLMGLLRPCVLLPDESLGDEALRLVFRHELTHCRRGDLWVKLLTLLAVSLHWYNPLIYVMRRELAFACEASCDERVLRGQDLDARARYSETIVAVIRRQSRSRTALTTAFYGGKKGMKNRILSIMNTRSRRLGIFILLPVLAFALLFSIALATEKPVEPIVWRAAGSPAFLFEAEKGEPLLTREEIEQRVAELFRLYDSAAVTNVETRPVTYGKDTFDTAVVDVSVRGHAEDEAETIRLYLTPRRGEVAAQTLVHASGFETGIRWAPFPLLEDVEALEATLPREAVVASPVADAGELGVGTDNAPMGVCFNGATVTVDALTDEYVPLAKGYWAHVNVAGGAEGWMPVSVLTFADEMTGEAPTLPQAEVKAQSGIAFVYEGCNFDTVLAEVRLGETVTLLGRFAEYWLVQLANGTCGFLPLENVSLDKATQALADGVLPDAFDKEQPERSPVRSLASLFKETGEYLTAERYQEILNQSAEDGAETVLERFEIRPVTFGLDTYDCAVADVSVTYVQYIGEEKIRINVGSYSRDYLTPVNGTFVASTWLDETEDGVVEQGLIGWDPLVMENAELRELESLLPHEAVVTNPVSGATSLRRWDLFYDFYDYSPVGAYLNGVTVTVDGLMLMENNVPELTDALTVYWAHVTVAGGEAAGGAEGWLPLDALTFRHSMTAEPAALPQAEVTADTSLYAGCDAESEALAAVPAGESVTLLGRFAAYWNVQLTDGTCGFLPLDCLAPDAETRALEAEVLPERFFVLQPGWQAKYEEYRAHISALDAEWGDPFGWTLEQRAELSDYMAQFPFEPDAPRCVLPGEGDLPRAEAEAVAWDYARRQLLMPAEQVDATSAILYMDTDGSRVWEIAYRLADGKTYYSVTLDQKGKVWMGGRYTLDDEEYDLTLGSGSLRIGGSSGDSGVIGIDISGLLSSSEPQQEDTGDFAYILLEDGTACIAAYHGEAKDVTIPAELGGRAVTAIGEYAFCWKGLTSVTLPEGLETIGTAAFLGCDLEEVTVPASVRAVGNSAFANCIFLNRATFLNPDTEIGEDAFLNCPSSLVITPAPEATPRPGMDALLKFEGGTDAETFACGDYVYSLLADGTAQIEYYTGEGGEVAVPSELDGHAVTSIGHMAFYGRIKVNSVSLPEGVKTIGEYAFCQCENLAKITLPAGLGTIAYRAFERCLSLTEIALPAGLESIAYEAFADCDSLTEIVLPEGLTELGEGAFEGCNALARVTLPESLETIGELAFARCRSLAEIRFSEGLKTIGPAAFMYCVSLAEIALPGSLEVIGEDAFSLCGLTDVKLPDGLKSLGGFAFSYCHDLTRVSLPDSLAQIGPNPFAFCPALEEIVLSPDHPLLEIVDGALMDKRGKRLIYYPIAKTETAYAVPEGTRSIGDSAFNRCAALTEITLPDSLTEIGVAAFMGCGRLKTMALPEGVTVLAESTFYGCESLERVTLPAGVTEIGEDAFAKCPETLVITVTAGSYAEQYCIENGLRYEALADTAGAEVGARFTCGDYVYSLLADGTAQIEYYAGAGGEVAVPAVLDGRAVTSIGSKAFYGR
ncbi:MAG: leucine-rich repeat protein, partial [Clostridia bacterium]|nr:leucine-rich repeat protein [Clostridia bacterium]